MSDTETEMVFPDGGCFGCSPTNPVGLGLRFWRLGNEITTRYSIPDRFRGTPGVSHGGVLATIIDEVSCACVHFIRGDYVVTGELSIRYEFPCPVEHPIVAKSRIVSKHPRYYVVETEVLDGTKRLAKATGKFFPTATEARDVSRAQA